MCDALKAAGAHYSSGFALRVKYLLWLLSIILLNPVFAQTESADRGLHRVPLVATTQKGELLELYNQSHALLIEVSEYDNGWSSLTSIPGELDQVEEVLRKKNFNVLRLRNPDDKELRAGIGSFIDEYGYDPGNRLLFYFSGHGHSEGNRGYLIPANTPLPEDRAGFRRSALSMNQIMTWARDMEAKHALFLFDSCFSGSIFTSKNLPATNERYIRRATEKPVRQFITAGSANEVVPAQSTFTPAFVAALEGEADTNDDGYITGSELGLHLSQIVPRYVEQTPQYGKIRDYHLAQGDFVFFNAAAEPEAVQSPQVNGNAEMQFWRSVEQGNSIGEYQAYLNRYPSGVFSELAGLRVARLREPEPSIQAVTQNVTSTENIQEPGEESVALLYKPEEIPQIDPEKPAAVSTLGVEQNNKGRLTVQTEPKTARVRIMNIIPRYQDGIELEVNGEYDILVTAQGYLPWRSNVLLEQSEQVVSVELKPRSVPVTEVEQIVEQVDEIAPDLSAEGNLLEPGKPSTTESQASSIKPTPTVETPFPSESKPGQEENQADSTNSVDQVSPRINHRTRDIKTVGETFRFIVEVTDNVGVESVKLYYGTSGYLSATLSAVEGKPNFYSATVSPTVGNRHLYYYIEAKDEAGNVGKHGSSNSPKLYKWTAATIADRKSWRTLFSSSFDKDSDKKWEFEDDRASAKIEKGRLTLKTKDESWSRYQNIDGDIGELDAIQFEAKLSASSRNPRVGNGLFLGDGRTYMYFLLSGTGKYALIETNPSGQKTLIDWTRSHAQKYNWSTNTLKLERNGRSIELFINDRKVSEYNHTGFKISKAGIFTSEKTTYRVYDISLRANI